MGLLDQPTLRDFVPWMNHSVPSDNRDFSRPRDGFYMSTTPTNLPDVNENWLGDAWKAIKDFVRVGPGEEEPKEDIKEIEKQITDIEKKEKEDKRPDTLIYAFQSFFSKSYPIIGQLYSGPKDGKMNAQLEAAAKEAENKISQAINDNGVKGMIWSGNSFQTSPADVKAAIDVIVKHSGQKTSFLNRKERILAFSSILDK